MRVSANAKWLLGLMIGACAFAWLVSSDGLAKTAVQETDRKFGVEVHRAVVGLHGDYYELSADMRYRLSARAKEALQNGVPLYWDIHIETLQLRDYLWNKTLANHVIRYRIQYHALLNMYRVKKEDGELSNFATLSAALGAMSSISNFRVMAKALCVPGERYAVGIKVTLDRDALPLPLRPVAYTNPQWYLSSDWTLWPLTK